MIETWKRMSEVVHIFILTTCFGIIGTNESIVVILVLVFSNWLLRRYVRITLQNKCGIFHIYPFNSTSDWSIRIPCFLQCACIFYGAGLNLDNELKYVGTSLKKDPLWSSNSKICTIPRSSAPPRMRPLLIKKLHFSVINWILDI